MEENRDYSVSGFLQGRPQRGHEQPDPETEADNPELHFWLSTNNTAAHLRLRQVSGMRALERAERELAQLSKEHLHEKSEGD